MSKFTSTIHFTDGKQLTIKHEQSVSSEHDVSHRTNVYKFGWNGTLVIADKVVAIETTEHKEPKE